MTYTNPTPEEITHLASLCDEPSYTMPPNLTRKERREFMRECLEHKQACDDVLLSRAENTKGSVCVSGEDVDGVHRKYSSEYLKWHLMYLHTKVAHCYTEEQRLQWFIENPAPTNKYRM